MNQKRVSCSLRVPIYKLLGERWVEECNLHQRPDEGRVVEGAIPVHPLGGARESETRLEKSKHTIYCIQQLTTHDGCDTDDALDGCLRDVILLGDRSLALVSLVITWDCGRGALVYKLIYLQNVMKMNTYHKHSHVTRSLP